MSLEGSLPARLSRWSPAGRAEGALMRAQLARLPVGLFHSFLFQAIFQGGLVY